ncbi:MAG TPA: hypothetical protein VMT24_13620 [Aggregatilineaceae bacterium]|nr:hypothetical protein [Aggregatilineaceae bacterium]
MADVVLPGAGVLPKGRTYSSAGERMGSSAASLPARPGRLWILVRHLGMLVIAVAVTAASAYDRISPRPDAIAALGLGRCQGLPCFRGITPGLTSWSEAQAALAPVQGSRVFGTQITVRLGTNGSGFLAHSRIRNTVGIVYLVFPSDARITAGDLIQRYGTPCGISFRIYPASSTLSLNFPWFVATATIVDRGLTVATPIQTISFRDPADTTRQPTGACPWVQDIFFTNRPWQGFASTSRYLESRPLQ